MVIYRNQLMKKKEILFILLQTELVVLQDEIDEGDFQHAGSNPAVSQNSPNISSNYEVSVSNENDVPISSSVNGRVKTFCSEITFNKRTKRKRYDEMEENLFHMKKERDKKKWKF
jgi:hypothetical protein